jgi:hypothetical protein
MKLARKKGVLGFLSLLFSLDFGSYTNRSIMVWYGINDLGDKGMAKVGLLCILAALYRKEAV